MNRRVSVDQTEKVPIGFMVAFGGSVEPLGWLFCYGQAVSRTGYGALFAAIGTAFGSGDGSTTFNVPDCRGRYFLGKDDLGGSSANRVTASQADNIGQSGGEEAHALTASEMPTHTHGQQVYNTPTAAGTLSMGGNDIANTAVVGNTLDSGSGTAHNNMPPYQTTAYIIKAS